MKLVFLSLAIASIWGMTSILQKKFLASITPEAALIAMGATFFVLTLMLAWMRHEHAFSKDKNEWSLGIVALLVGSASLGYVAYYALFSLIKHYDVHIVIALTYVTPLITLALAYFLLEEAIAWQAALGALLIVGGIVMITLSHAP